MRALPAGPGSAPVLRRRHCSMCCLLSRVLHSHWVGATLLAFSSTAMMAGCNLSLITSRLL